MKTDSYISMIWRRFRRNRRAVAGLIGMGIIVLTSCLSPLLATNQPIVCRYKGKLYFPAVVEMVQWRSADSHWLKKSHPFDLPQFDAKVELDPDAFAIWPLIPYHENEQTDSFLAAPSATHWLGADELGRDLAARMIHGTTVSVKVGLLSMAIAAIIGITAGGLAGYWGGWVDIIISRIIEIVICFPVFFLILAIIAWLGPGIANVMIVIGLTRWTSIARYARGEFMRIKAQDYIIAARAIGAGHMRIMTRHMLPNALAPVLVSVAFGIAGAILIEAGLSWLGFGVQPPQPSWGNILRTAYEVLRIAPHMVYPPCIAIFMAVLSCNLVGDGLRDAIDPR